MTTTISRFAGAFVAAGFLAGAGIAEAQSVRWDLTNDYQAASLPAQTDQVFADRLKELSNGDIAVTLHLGGSLGYKSQDAFDAVRNGAVPVASAATIFWGGIHPMFKLSGVPFLPTSTDEARILMEVARESYEEVLEENNQVLLYTAPWPPSGIWSEEPVDSLDKLKGLKIRTYDTNGTQTLQRLAASPVQLAWGDVVPQLAANGIDAVLTSADGGVGAKFWEHVDYFTEINYAMPLQMTTLNKDEWDALSDEQKAMVREAAKAAEDFAWEALGTRVEKNYETMKANGVTIVTELSPEYVAALLEAGTPAHAAWAAELGPKGEAILKAFSEKVGR